MSIVERTHTRARTGGRREKSIRQSEGGTKKSVQALDTFARINAGPWQPAGRAAPDAPATKAPSRPVAAARPWTDRRAQAGLAAVGAGGSQDGNLGGLP